MLYSLREPHQKSVGSILGRFMEKWLSSCCCWQTNQQTSVRSSLSELTSELCIMYNILRIKEDKNTESELMGAIFIMAGDRLLISLITH